MEQIKLWKDREKNQMDPFLLSQVAEDFARQMAREYSEHKNDKKKKGEPNKQTQFRKFFDETLRLNMAARANTNNWPNILPLVHMLTAKAAYAHARDLVSKGFLDFIKNGVRQIELPKDLDAFSMFFEAFIGFYKLHGPKKN